MDEETIKALINQCAYKAGHLEKLFQQDSMDMEDCTRGEILVAYKQAVDKGIEMVQTVQHLLEELYNDYAVPK